MNKQRSGMLYAMARDRLADALARSRDLMQARLGEGEAWHRALSRSPTLASIATDPRISDSSFEGCIEALGDSWIARSRSRARPSRWNFGGKAHTERRVTGDTAVRLDFCFGGIPASERVTWVSGLLEDLLSVSSSKAALSASANMARRPKGRGLLRPSSSNWW